MAKFLKLVLRGDGNLPEFWLNPLFISAVEVNDALSYKVQLLPFDFMPGIDMSAAAFVGLKGTQGIVVLNSAAVLALCSMPEFTEGNPITQVHILTTEEDMDSSHYAIYGKIADVAAKLNISV